MTAAPATDPRPKPVAVPRPRPLPMSRHERIVLDAFLFDGADNATVAARCKKDIETVKTHLARVMRRAGVGNRTELAVALLRGWLIPVVVTYPSHFRAPDA